MKAQWPSRAKLVKRVGEGYELAAWITQFGQVSAVNESLEVRAFGYDMGAALDFAGVLEQDELALWKQRGLHHRLGKRGPKPGKVGLWALRR